MISIHRRGLLLVLSSPSGAGKTTLARRLLTADVGIASSVSVTTRTARPGEVEGEDYFFVDETRFQEMRDAGELLEWAKVFDNFYGTPRRPVELALEGGRDVLFDIDWQGARQLAERMPGDIVRVFILPPTAADLAGRLAARGQDSADVIQRRMEAASAQISHWPEYDYVIVNADLDASSRNLLSILAAERLRRQRQLGLNDFVRELQDGL